ncbi:peroxisomal membrane protein PEX14-like [Lolium rigidum]|uniref:peroxisomal membrane protein PEX14-like n=1 Tax=Lolium rigidum TaxID=89674 RepID=UPI001F5CA797|nr:peroxisomal membrane protein PEX14-like [Lolium rigidum]
MAAQSPSSSPQDGSGAGGSSDNLVFQAPQAVREDYIQNAVKFLAHPKVKGSPVSYRYSFLEKKGLTKDEIEEAFRRVPDPQPNSTEAAAVGSQQASNPNQSAGAQPYTSVQSPLATTGSVSTGHIVPQTQTQFSWFHTLLGAGIFLGFGASSVVIIKNVFLPRLKSWTCRVVSEGDENADNELKSKLYDEIKKSMETSSSAFSAIAKTNQELLASKDEDKKILVKLTEALDSQAEVLKSLSETLNQTRENRFSQYNMLEEHVQPGPWNGPTTNSWRASQQTNMYTTTPNGDFDSGRQSFMPLPAEPTSGSFPRSYVEQRVPRSGYGFQPQMGNDRSNYGSPPYYSGGSNPVEAPAPVAAPTPVPTPVVEESPFQRRWVPPQPPGVAMPEAAAAIRQPRSLPRQESQPEAGAADASRPSASTGSEQMDSGTSGAADVGSPSSSAPAAGTMDGVTNGVNGEGTGAA